MEINNKKHISDHIKNIANRSDYKIEFKDIFKHQHESDQKCSLLKPQEDILLIKKYKKHYDDHKIAEEVYCIVQKKIKEISSFITDDVKKYGDNMLIPAHLNTKKFKEVFGKLKQISKGSYGITYKLNYYDIADVFIIKCPLKDSLKDQETMHETNIGNHLNTLRKKTSGFMYSFGGFYCGIPTTFSTICQSTKPENVSFLSIYEYVPSMTLGSYLSSIKLDSKEAIKILLLILRNIDIAQTEYKFIHNDLHSNNVLLSERDVSQKIKIKGLKSSIEINTNFEPVIIDFGMSRINVNNVDIISPSVAKMFKSKKYIKTFDIYRLMSDLIFNRSTINSKYANKFLSYFWNKADKVHLKHKLQYDYFGRLDNEIDTKYPFFISHSSDMLWASEIFELGSVTEYIDLLISFL